MSLWKSKKIILIGVLVFIALSASVAAATAPKCTQDLPPSLKRVIFYTDMQGFVKIVAYDTNNIPYSNYLPKGAPANTPPQTADLGAAASSSPVAGEKMLGLKFWLKWWQIRINAKDKNQMGKDLKALVDAFQKLDQKGKYDEFGQRLGRGIPYVCGDFARANLPISLFVSDSQGAFFKDTPIPPKYSSGYRKSIVDIYKKGAVLPIQIEVVVAGDNKPYLYANLLENSNPVIKNIRQDGTDCILITSPNQAKGFFDGAASIGSALPGSSTGFPQVMALATAVSLAPVMLGVIVGQQALYGCTENKYALDSYTKIGTDPQSYQAKFIAKKTVSDCFYGPSAIGLVPNSEINVTMMTTSQEILDKVGKTLIFEKYRAESMIINLMGVGRIIMLRGDKDTKGNAKTTRLPSIKQASIRVTKKDTTTQEIEYAKFFVHTSVGEESYSFEYKGKTYTYAKMKHNDEVLFSPTNGKYGFGSGVFEVAGKAGKCTFSGPLLLEGLDPEKSCTPAHTYIPKGKSTHLLEGILTVTATGEMVEVCYTRECFAKAKAPAILAIPNGKGQYIVESKGILQYQHLNTIIRANTPTTETTFNIHNPLNSLWVRTGEAIVEKGGAVIKITSTQTGVDCIVSVKQDILSSTATLQTTEGLLIGGTVKDGKCMPGNDATALYMIGPSGNLYSKFGAGTFSSLTADDVAVLNGQLPIGVPLQSRVNGLVTVIDLLLKVKRGVAEANDVEIKDLDSMSTWGWVKTFGSQTMRTPLDVINWIAPGCNEDRYKFGIYLHSTMLGLHNLKKTLLKKGVSPLAVDEIIEQYGKGFYENPQTEKYEQMPGTTQLTYDLLKLVDQNGQIELTSAIGLALKFRRGGEESTGGFLKSLLCTNYLKDDYFGQYYLLMDIGMDMFKLQPFKAGNQVRSINFYENGAPTLSYYLHTEGLLGSVDPQGNDLIAKTERRGISGWGYIGWSNDVEDEYYTLKMFKGGRGSTIPPRITAFVLRDGYKLVVESPDKDEGKWANTALQSLQSEINSLKQMEASNPKIVEYGKIYDAAYDKKFFESLKGFLAEWVDPFLVADAAMVLGKVAIRAVRVYKALKALRLAENLKVIKYTGKARAFETLEIAFEVMRTGKVGGLRGFELVSGCAAKICFLKNLDEAQQLIAREFGEDTAEQFSRSMDDAIERLDDLEDTAGVMTRRAETPPAQTRGGIIVTPEELGQIGVRRIDSMDILLRNARAGKLSGLIKFPGGKNGLTMKVGKQQKDATIFYITEEYANTYTNLLEKTELGWHGKASFDQLDMIVVVPDKLVEESGQKLSNNIAKLMGGESVDNILTTNQDIWRRVRGTSKHELQHSTDFANGLTKSPIEVLEGRAGTASFTNVPLQDVVENFKQYTIAKYPTKSPHQVGQIEVLAEFLRQYGIGGELSGITKNMEKQSFFKQVIKIKTDDNLYAKLRRDALQTVIKNKVTAQELQKFGNGIIATYTTPINLQSIVH